MWASIRCQKAVFPQFSPSLLLQMHANPHWCLPFSGQRRSLMWSGRGSCRRIIMISCRGWLSPWWFLQRRSCFCVCVIPVSLMVGKRFVSLPFSCLSSSPLIQNSPKINYFLKYMHEYCHASRVLWPHLEYLHNYILIGNHYKEYICLSHHKKKVIDCYNRVFLSMILITIMMAL